MSTKIPTGNLGGYLREQRQAAQLSIRQLAERTGISNPYLSQLERGLKKPSAEILQSLAKGLRISAETLYVQAGFLEPRSASEVAEMDVRLAIAADQRLTPQQRRVLLDVYSSFVGTGEFRADEEPDEASEGSAVPETVRATTGTAKSTDNPKK